MVTGFKLVLLGRKLARVRKSAVLDLFCGCGGLSQGFLDAGYAVKFGIDNDEKVLKTFAHNHPASEVFMEDLGNLDVKKFIKANISEPVDVVIGGPPCQGFSLSGKREINDPRNGYYRPYFEFVNELKPKVFLMENVPNFISMGKGQYRDIILDLFAQIGYSVTYKILLASEYGVPQNRKRVFFVGVREGQDEFEFPEAEFGESSPLRTSWDAISDLPERGLEDGVKYTRKPVSDYQKLMRKDSKGIFNHQITEHAEKTVKIISMVPDGGNYKDLPEEYRETRRVNIAWTRYSSKKPSHTIDTGHRHHFHYKYNRVPTVRESARLQSFSDDFIFLGSKTQQYKHVGNAVPPLLAKKLAEEIQKQVL